MLKQNKLFIFIFMLSLMGYGILEKADLNAQEVATIDPEAGFLIASGQQAAITIAGDCRIITNHIPETTIFIQTVDTDHWPDLEIIDEKGKQLIEAEPCKDI